MCSRSRVFIGSDFNWLGHLEVKNLYNIFVFGFFSVRGPGRRSRTVLLQWSRKLAIAPVHPVIAESTRKLSYSGELNKPQ